MSGDSATGLEPWKIRNLQTREFQSSRNTGSSTELAGTSGSTYQLKETPVSVEPDPEIQKRNDYLFLVLWKKTRTSNLNTGTLTQFLDIESFFQKYNKKYDYLPTLVFFCQLKKIRKVQVLTRL
jgi:hypothetical protein